MTAQKDPHFLASLITLVETKRPNLYRWVVLGDGPLMGDFKAATRLFPNVSTLGWVTQDVVHQSLAQSHLFVSTSRWEADPFSVKEALRHRCHLLLRDLPIHNTYGGTYDNVVIFVDLHDASDKLDYLISLPLPDHVRVTVQPASVVTIAGYITEHFFRLTYHLPD